jgi:transposase
MDHRTLEEIRKMAVERVREGEKPSAVIASYGFHRCVIYRWLKAAAGRGKGSVRQADVNSSPAG